MVCGEPPPSLCIFSEVTSRTIPNMCRSARTGPHQGISWWSSHCHGVFLQKSSRGKWCPPKMSETTSALTLGTLNPKWPNILGDFWPHKMVPVNPPKKSETLSLMVHIRWVFGGVGKLVKCKTWNPTFFFWRAYFLPLQLIRPLLMGCFSRNERISRFFKLPLLRSPKRQVNFGSDTFLLAYVGSLHHQHSGTLN